MLRPGIIGAVLAACLLAAASRADAQTPADKRERTMALTGLLRLARTHWERNARLR